MSQATNRDDGAVVGEFLSIADLLEDPRCAHVYAYLTREGEATVQKLMAALELPQGTAYNYVNRLVEAGLIEVTSDEQPRTYAARAIELTVTAGETAHEYTITPLLVDAVGRRTSDADIDTYIDRHGIAGLATALTYTIARERGEITHRIMATDLDISPLAAELILQALRPVVHEHRDLEVAGASASAIDDTTTDP
ncbi:MAG: helix-turn-helix domain-containing protein [Natrialbaceae archaeon]|nr:helix-turn-helix domain-containing protein [Natrialbaceae archaeon]